jgi:hypothetical protein
MTPTAYRHDPDLDSGGQHLATAIAIELDPVYDDSYYRSLGDTSLSSARIVVPIVLDLVRPDSVVDVGCGSGAWLSVFADHGVRDILGIDGYGPDHLLIPAGSFRRQDLDTEVRLDRNFDLAVCLEVAEHLRPDSAETLVASLINLAPVVLFSAAAPMQGGTQHINERWPAYWCDLFAQHRFAVLDPIRRQVWSAEDVAWWYAQNTLIYVSEDELNRRPALKEQARITYTDQLNLVHPQMLARLTAKPEVLELPALLRSQFRLLARAPRATARAILDSLPRARS